MKQTNSTCGDCWDWAATPRNACAGAYSSGLVANRWIIMARNINLSRH
ncbi:hypothetical protein HU200_043808 [Digitaria exilis]|uniref:Uncharacterized protein n=1 Tax=Digitaria exilis TaxID=1010633 RepID=A0A835EDG9_9POAL|nr:hypothetical protein HU200_043808 [Digitaria exilis]